MSTSYNFRATAAGVHEAFVRLVDQTNPQQWDNSRHFFSAAAESMRRIPVHIQILVQRLRILHVTRERIDPVEPPVCRVVPARPEVLHGEALVGLWPSTRYSVLVGR